MDVHDLPKPISKQLLNYHSFLATNQLNNGERDHYSFPGTTGIPTAAAIYEPHDEDCDKHASEYEVGCIAFSFFLLVWWCIYAVCFGAIQSLNSTWVLSLETIPNMQCWHQCSIVETS